MAYNNDEEIRTVRAELREAKLEIARLRTIVRVNGLRWGHTHKEIDEILGAEF